MFYAASGETALTDWSSAARSGGLATGTAAPGSPRTHAVDAYVDAAAGPVLVSGIWASRLPEDARKALLRELDLPVKKQLVYRPYGSEKPRGVADFMVVDVWDGWCALDLKLSDGTAPALPVNSMHLAEQNTGSTLCPPEFFVFDLETTGTNPKTAEIAEIAALRVVDGVPADEFETTVFIDGEMPEAARAVNGISDDEMAAAPHMTSALLDFMAFIGPEAVLVGHNVKTFDIPLIERVAASCGVLFGYKRAEDSLELARLAWPGEGHRMDELRIKFGLTGEGAHRALKDCRDELAVYLEALKELKEHPEKKRAKPKPAKVEDKGPRARPGAKFSAKWKSRRAKDFAPATTDFDPSHPAYGKLFAFTNGTAEETERAMQAVCDLGGTPKDSVTMKTSYLVVFKDGETGKVETAKRYIGRGKPIQIIDAARFEEILEGRE